LDELMGRIGAGSRGWNRGARRRRSWPGCCRTWSTPDECLLISATRLDETPLRAVADTLGVSVALASAWRRAAEQRLAGAIADGELDWVPLVPAGTRRRHPTEGNRAEAGAPPVGSVGRRLGNHTAARATSGAQPGPWVGKEPGKRAAARGR
jgi:hypothetical protein